MRGRLTGYEDEDARRAGDRARSYSAILEAEIERPRVGPMRDIVATIQPEQDVIVRADLAGTVCVQGAPGTGKTAVGLHRAAYLLYAHRDQLAARACSWSGRTRRFLRYIGDVLPALGELEAGRPRSRSWSSRTLPGRRRAAVRGDGHRGGRRRSRVTRGWPTVLRARGLVPPRRARPRAWSCPAGRARWRVPAYEVEEIVATLRAPRRPVRRGARRCSPSGWRTRCW